MLQLTRPDPAFYSSFSESLAEWDGVRQDGLGTLQHDSVETLKGFTTWTQELLEAENQPEHDGIVPCTYLWITDACDFVGAIAFRHTLTPALLKSGGHIGYSVRPSRRRQGVASWALGTLCNKIATTTDHRRLLLTCDDSNFGSIATIERCGGKLEDVRSEPMNGRKTRRYWIDLPRALPAV